jgi:hypothetical protein
MATAGQTHDIVLDIFGFNLAAKQGNYRMRTTSPTRNAYLAENEHTTGTPPADVTGANGAPITTHRLYYNNWTSLGNHYYDPPNHQRGQTFMLDRARPIAQGQALSFIPQERLYLDNPTTTTNYFGSWQMNNNLYLYRDGQIYLVTTTGGLFTNYTTTGMPAPLPNPITDVHIWYNAAYLATGTNSYYWSGTGATTTIGIPRTYWQRYHEMEIWSEGSSLKWNINSTNITRNLGSNINSILVAYDAVWITTDTAIWRLKGKPVAGNPTVNPNTLNSFTPDLDQIITYNQNNQSTTHPQNRNGYNLKAFAGYLWYYANGQIHRFKPDQAQLTHQTQPIHGDFRGMNICDGLLVVAVSSPYNSQLFAWQPDPEGWFRLAGQLNTVNRNYTAPFTMLPNAQDGAVATFVANKETLIRLPLDNRYLSRNHPTNHTLPTATVLGTIALPIITPNDLATHAGKPNHQINWVRPLRLGIEWGTIVNDSESFDQWADLNSYINQYFFKAQISMDSGKTWSNLNTTGGVVQYYPQTNEQHNGKATFEIQGSAPTGTEFDIAPASRSSQSNPPPKNSYQPFGWMFRVQHQGPYAPALRRIWLDYQTIPLTPQTGRKWEILIALMHRPGKIQQDNQPDQQLPSYTPLQWLRHLTGWWQQGTLLNFYDLENKQYKIKITNIEATSTSPGYRPTLTTGGGNLKPEFEIKLELTEIFTNPTLTDTGDGQE